MTDIEHEGYHRLACNILSQAARDGDAAFFGSEWCHWLCDAVGHVPSLAAEKRILFATGGLCGLGRTCIECGGSISDTNMSGYCVRCFPGSPADRARKRIRNRTRA